MANERRIQIHLKDYKNSKSTAFIGRMQGEEVRRKMELDKHDKDNGVVVNFIFPADTTSINPSFFLGLFFPSIKELNLEAFRKKYYFDFETENSKIKRLLNHNIDDGLRLANNARNLKNPLFEFVR